ncbi:hypothetical protein PW52_08280 [Tamlana sedimentorum]|uniref:Uncharacterized protein n=1 Tax=Neotamlana sedimentorum TaxID=1435349 RepID=A0A0D7W9E5_9FLAO|nr:hypothetical protein [Tamlana sedimentorum]KJD35729.1 hypothetical protein PW52_08280 [Tamlana sedimentorum]
MGRKIVEINTTQENNIELFSKSGTAFFDVFATIKKCDNQKIPNEILIELKNINKSVFFHLSKCKFCKRENIFEIHVENTTEIIKKHGDLSYKYLDAKKEGFNLIPLDIKHIYQVNILVYNSDPSKPEKTYFICNKKSKKLLKYQPKINALNFVEFQPDSNKGNIILGNP